jgi:hypothetical protein
VVEPGAFVVEMSIEKLQGNKLPGSDHTPVDMIKGKDKTIRSVLQKLTDSMWSEEEFPEEWNESIILTVYKRGVVNKVKQSRYRPGVAQRVPGS